MGTAPVRLRLPAPLDQPDDRAAVGDAGADAYLVKPFSSLALLEAVQRLTDG
jgi:DNA-binding response OmpR family regulator